MTQPPASAGLAAGGLAGPPKARLAENVVHFVRALRACGLPLGPAKALDALAAVEAVGVERREDFRAALAAILVSRREHLTLFEQAFDVFWRNPRLLAGWAAFLLVMHWVDVYWLAMPELLVSPSIGLTELGCLVAFGGLLVAAWSKVAAKHALIPVHDPRLPESLAFHVT